MNPQTSINVINSAVTILQEGRKRNECTYQSDVTLSESSQFNICDATFEIYDDGDCRAAFLESIKDGKTQRVEITQLISDETLADMTCDC